MKIPKKPIRIAPINDASVRRVVKRWAKPVFQGAIYALGILPMVLGLGLLITEGLPNMRPNIPEPETNTAEQMPAEPTDPPTMTLSKRVILYVHPLDRPRLAQMIKKDIDRHGGWTIRHNHKGRALTGAVPQDYIKRLQPLISSSGVKPPSAAYQEWARMVHQHPHDPTITGPADTMVSLWIGVPIITNQITKTLMWWTAVPSLIALLIALLGIPINVVAERLTADS